MTTAPAPSIPTRKERLAAAKSLVASRKADHVAAVTRLRASKKQYAIDGKAVAKACSALAKAKAAIAKIKAMK